MSNKKILKDKRVLITGIGSIGSEVVRQVCFNGANTVILFDRNEEKIFYLEKEINRDYPEIKVVSRIGSITDKKRVDMVFEETQPQIVIHTAAMKHVPLCEENPYECVINNVGGTKNIVEVSVKHSVEQFFFISTDKAVEPISVMGMSKRLCELFIMSIWDRYLTKFIIVRFGNVYGSSGSVVEIFEKQLPNRVLTVTHPEMERYFISVEEAVDKLIRIKESGLYVLNMGKPVNIFNLANQLIEASGRPCKIEITGIRPGEKLKEKLLYPYEVSNNDKDVMTVASKEHRYKGDDYRDICLLINDCNNMNKEHLLIEIDQIING